MTSRGQKMWNAKLSADVDVYQRRSISCICTYICCWNRMLTFSCSLANGHIMLNTPVLVRSLKLSNIEPSQYLDGWPPGNTGCCWLSKTFCKVSQFWFLCSAWVDINNLVKRLESIFKYIRDSYWERAKSVLLLLTRVVSASSREAW
jgi:hypothetical protein